MKTTLVSLSLDKQFTGEYRHLLRNLGLLLLLIIVITTSAVVYFDERLVKELSAKLITSTTTTVSRRMDSFFEVAETNLLIAIEQLQRTEAKDNEFMDQLFQSLSPFLNQYRNANGIQVAEVGTGKEYMMLIPTPEETLFLVRRHDPAQWGTGRARFEHWQDGEMLETWFRNSDYDPATRPWYKSAMQADENVIIATEPYIFHALQKPGLSLSARWRKHDSDKHYIAAFHIVLTFISHMTQSIRPTEDGMVFVLTRDKRLVGLPADARFEDAHAVDAALLDPVDEVNLPVVRAAVAEWEWKERTQETFPFDFSGQTWWAGFETEKQGLAHDRLWTGILVPESDFIGALAWQRNIALVAIFGLGLLLAVVIIIKYVHSMRRDLRDTINRIGRKLGPFELLYKIGDGGNGAVYRAQHALLRRPTAVKVMRPEFAHSESAKQRFAHEVRITSSLTHPNTIAVYDFGQTADGTLYYAMEHLNGVTLEELVHISGPLTPARVIYILYQACGSLAEAHGRGLIHRDIKPSNIFLCERGGVYDVVKVLDFGLVKDTRQTAPELTQANAVVGTPLYLAPELITDAAGFSPASDLYALGAVGYYLLTGRNVFEGTNAVEICAMHLHDEPVLPSQRSGRVILADLEALIMACLAKKPEQRPQSAEAMAEALVRCEAFAAWDEEQARQWWWDNRNALPMETQDESHTPLSDTHLLVDMDERLGYQGASNSKG